MAQKRPTLHSMLQTCQEPSLTKAILHHAHAYSANLSGAQLMRADLREVELLWADLSGASFVGADLRSADLRFTRLHSLITSVPDGFEQDSRWRHCYGS